MKQSIKSSKNLSNKTERATISKVAKKGGRLNIAHLERMIETLNQRAADDREALEDCISILDDFVDTLYDLEMSLEDETSKEELQAIYDNIMEAVEEVDSCGNDPYYRTSFTERGYEDILSDESLLLNT